LSPAFFVVFPPLKFTFSLQIVLMARPHFQLF
jgi:hypothetical protein